MHVILLAIALSFCTATSALATSGTQQTVQMAPVSNQNGRNQMFRLPGETSEAVAIIPSDQGRTPKFLTSVEVAGGGTSPGVRRASGAAHIGNCKEWINVRDDPSTVKPAIGRLNLGESVTILYWNLASDWTYVSYNNGNDMGWVSCKFIK